MVERWAITSAGELLFEEVDDFLCCYSCLTGKTYLFDAFPAEILKLLASQPHSSAELGGELARIIGEGEAQDWRAQVESVLQELRGLSLVESEPP